MFRLGAIDHLTGGVTVRYGALLGFGAIPERALAVRARVEYIKDRINERSTGAAPCR